MNTQSLKTAKEAGARLGVSEVTVLRLFDNGALPGVVIRSGARKRTIRFRDEAIEKFITSREQRAGEKTKSESARDSALDDRRSAVPKARWSAGPLRT